MNELAGEVGPGMGAEGAGGKGALNATQLAQQVAATQGQSSQEDIQEIDRLQSQIRLMKKDNESLQVDITAMTGDYRQLQGEFRKEKERREKLETFLKEVALKPE